MHADCEVDRRPTVEIILNGHVELSFRAVNWRRMVDELAASLSTVMVEESFRSGTTQAATIDVWDGANLLASFSVRFQAHRLQPLPGPALKGIRHGASRSRIAAR